MITYSIAAIGFLIGATTVTWIWWCCDRQHRKAIERADEAVIDWADYKPGGTD